MKIQLLSEPQYKTAFAAAFADFEIVESGADVIVDTRFWDVNAKLASPACAKLVITNTLTHSTSAYQAGDVIGIPMLPHNFAKQSTYEYSEAVRAGASTHTSEFFTTFKKTAEKINDCVAGVFPRALCMIINEAAFALQESVASAHDIDQAMKLGTNYPKGPLAWCDEIGAVAIVATLDALAKEYGNDRYRVASLLRRHAESGLPFYPN